MYEEYSIADHAGDNLATNALPLPLVPTNTVAALAGSTSTAD
jgi:hypothetical protein